jgi:type II secretory pathway component PulF
LTRLAIYKEKTLAIKGKIKSALFYPVSILVVAFVVTAVIMIWVVPAFKQVFASFGADLPGPTLVVMAISDFFVANWYLIFGGLFAGLYFFFQSWRRSLKIQRFMDKTLLKAPIFGAVIRKATIARWTRTLAIKAKIKSALMYPCAILGIAFIVTAVIMIWVVPAFKSVFSSFGADLPAPTLIVMSISDFVVAWAYIIFPAIFAALYFFFQAWRRSPKMQKAMDRILLKLPIFGPVIRKATIARWTRTLSTMFAAGVPLVEALDSVGGASGNDVYLDATRKIQTEVSTGTSLTVAMQNANVFPNMVTQMVSIGEESGALDGMLGKVADFYEEEVDEAVASLSSLMEPLIMVILGVLIGGLVVAMYLPIFKLGSVV